MDDNKTLITAKHAKDAKKRESIFAENLGVLRVLGGRIFHFDALGAH